MARVLLFGAAWMALLAALAVGVSMHDRPAKPPALPRQPAAAPWTPPVREGERFPGWTVTRAYSAHHMMVVEVETDGAASPTSIAAQIVEPLKDRYDEVLLYVRLPGQTSDDLPARRIQWTPRTGYVESVYR